MIVDPLGTVLAELSEEEGVVLAEVSEEAVRQARAKNRILRDLRRDVIEELLAQYSPGWTAPPD
jgi:predicted amidohydrolase